MRSKINIYGTALLGVLTLMSSFALQSCEDQPDKYETTSGTPTIYYARLSDVAAKDSLVEGAYMGTYVTLIGENLRSVTKMYFNDQEAVLNSSLITDNTLIVQVPNNLSDNPTDKIYMVNTDNDTTTYDFKTLVPNPVVSSMDNESAVAGDTVTLKGDYLLNYATSPLKVTFVPAPTGATFTAYVPEPMAVFPAGKSISSPLEVTNKFVDPCGTVMIAPEAACIKNKNIQNVTKPLFLIIPPLKAITLRHLRHIKIVTPCHAENP